MFASSTRAGLIILVTLTALLAVFVGAIYALAVFVESVAFSTNLSALSVRIALSSVFVAFALILYVLKKSRGQFVCGMLEVACGIVANWQTLDNWFHPANSAALGDMIYARLILIGGGTYAISRGVTNVAEGLEKFFPKLWPLLRAQLSPAHLREVYLRGAYKPRLDVPTDQLKFQIWSNKDRLVKVQKEFDKAVRKGRNTRLLQIKLDLIREEMKIATERYQREVTEKSLPEGSH